MAETEKTVDDEESSETPERVAQRKADRDGYVPLERAQRMAENATRREREATDERIAKLEKRETTDQAPREYTRVELTQFVSEGRVTQNDANALWDQQQETRLERKFEQRLDARLAESTRAVAVDEQVNRYKELIPGLVDPDSEASRKFEKERTTLAGMGLDPEKLDLLAYRSTFGPADALQRSRTEYETHHESDARGGSDDTTGDVDKDGWPKGLSNKQKTYYDDAIRTGVYKNRQAVVELHQRHAKRQTARA